MLRLKLGLEEEVVTRVDSGGRETKNDGNPLLVVLEIPVEFSACKKKKEGGQLSRLSLEGD